MSRFFQGFPLLALLAAVPAWSDDTGLGRCRELADSRARLACYDALPLARTPSPASVPPATAAVATPAAPPKLIPEAREARFGMEQKAAAQEELPAIQSHIPGLFEGWRPNMRIRLANGQVWQVVDEGSRRMQLHDAKVRVRRGMMGAFYLEFEAHNHSPRVRRIQ
jgi:hypothetical protein